MSGDGRARAHFLLAGDGADLPQLQRAIERLPVDAYGQVFVEIAAPIQIRRLTAPERMTVTWLCRGSVAGRGGRPHPRGARLVEAIRGWIAEWMPEHRPEGGLPTVLWIGGAENDRINGLYEELAARFDHVHQHHHGTDRPRPAPPTREAS